MNWPRRSGGEVRGVPGLATLTLLIFGSLGLASSEAGETSVQIEKRLDGQRIYREGVLPSGLAVRGFTYGDIPLSSAQIACENCHRRSGFGSSEGGKVVPPITGQALFMTRESDLQVPFRSRSLRGRGRPAYDLASLATVLRDGIDSGGRQLDPLMPRYEMNDSDIEALSVYLKSLAFELSAGVEESKIHLATIAAKNADASERASMLEIIQAFAADKNSNSRNESGRAARGPYFRAYMDVSYRKWDLHVWELEGEPETWREQLEALYAAQPVFALVSGRGDGSWQPVHDFCEANEIPCIFPITDQPVLDEDFYSIYLSGGLYRAAEAVAGYLEGRLATGPAPVLQVYRSGSEGEVMAEAVLEASGKSSPAIESVKIETASTPGAGFWETLFRERGPGIVLLWLKASDLGNLTSESILGLGAPGLVVLSDTLTGEEAYSSLQPIRERVRVVSLRELPERRERGLLRLRAWLKPRDIALSHPRIQADALLAATLVGSSIRHMRRNFSREYMIEIIEHGLDNSVFRSVYPQLTLGPNQRLASKSVYVLRPLGDGQDGWESVDEAVGN